MSVNRIALIILLLWAGLAILAPFLPLSSNEVQLDKILQAPQLSAWLGYDDLGRPILHRLIIGAQTSFYVAVWVTVLSLVFGCFIGCLAAYLGGWVDELVVRVIDVFLAVPGILLAIAFAGFIGPGLSNLVLALSLVGWVGYARLTRAQVLSVKQRDHVQAAKALGSSTGFIMRKHLLPLISAPLIVESSFGIAGIVIAEAGLSFLGLGVQAPDASWGSMIRDGTMYMLISSHMVLAPGIAIMLVVFAVNYFGDSLRDRMDVRS